MNQAKKHNLEFVPDWTEYLAPNPLEDMHDSFKGVLAVGEESYRKINPDDNIHESVLRRTKERDDYKPINLPDGLI